jgi:hypothetical protein
MGETAGQGNQQRIQKRIKIQQSFLCNHVAACVCDVACIIKSTLQHGCKGRIVVFLLFCYMRNGMHSPTIKEKEYRDCWQQRSTFRKTWGLKPRMLYWICTAVLRPIVAYAATVRWLRVNSKEATLNLANCKGWPAWISLEPCKQLHQQ